MGPVVFQPYQGDSVPGRRQGSLQVGERLLETTLINDTFTSLVLPGAGTDSCPFTREGVGNPHTAEDPAGPCSKQVYVTTLALGLLAVFQHPYQLPLLGMGTSREYSAQAGQSFPPHLKDGDATAQPTRTLGKIAGTSEKRRSSWWETPKNAQVLFPPRFQPRHCSCLPHSLRVGHQPEGAAGTSLHGRALPPPPGTPGVKSGV